MTDIIAERLQELRTNFQSWDVDAVFIDSPANRRWLSGFTGSAGRLLITHHQAILAADSRYWQQAALDAPDFELFRDKRRQEDTVELLHSTEAKRIGIEANHLTLSNFNLLNHISGVTLVPLESPVEPLRRIKSADEIALIQSAAAITDEAMSLVPKLVQPGITEYALAWELEKTMRELGANGLAFPIIVAFGPNSALPHHHPTDRRLQPNEIVLVDMGAEVKGYKSDMTRTFFLGGGLTDQYTKIYDLVLAALETSAGKMKPGINTHDAHGFAMEVIAAGGHGQDFTHGLGHGVGLEIHEEPFISNLRPNGILAEGMVITVEPGIYLPGWGGIRIEDLYLVTETGLKALSKCPKIAQISI